MPWSSAGICADYDKLLYYNDKILFINLASWGLYSDKCCRPTLLSLENLSLVLASSFLSAFRQTHSKAERESPWPAIFKMSHRLTCIFSLVSSSIIMKCRHLNSIVQELHRSALLYHYSVDEGKFSTWFRDNIMHKSWTTRKPQHISDNVTATSVITHCCIGARCPTRRFTASLMLDLLLALARDACVCLSYLHYTVSVSESRPYHGL